MMDNYKRVLRQLPVRCIRQTGPRPDFDREEMRELTDSVTLYGVLQPPSGRRTAASPCWTGPGVCRPPKRQAWTRCPAL